MDSLTQTVRELTGSVGALMNELKKTETRIRSLEQLNSRPFVPEVVPLCAPASESDLKDIGKLPDSVKELQTFEGNPSQYVSWIHTVEGILSDYEIVRGKPIFRAILKSIRGKIRGSADSALVSHNIFDDDWPAIKACLSLHYADKRDIRTLEHQLGQLMQGHSKLDEFYAKVNHQCSLIINKIKTENYTTETVNVLMETYRNRALDVFIRGLTPDLSRMIIVQKPNSLPEAYTACLDIQNLNYRSHPIHPSNTRNTVSVPMNQLSGRNNAPTIQHRRPTTYEANKNNKFSWKSGNYYPPPRNNATGVVEKMEVDPSVQTRRTNYRNEHGSVNHFKRRNGSDNYRPKHQRVFNIETGNNNSMTEQNGQDVNFTNGAYPAYLI